MCPCAVVVWYCTTMVPAAERTNERTSRTGASARRPAPSSCHLYGPRAPYGDGAGPAASPVLYVFNARVTGGVHVDGRRLGGDRAGTGASYVPVGARRGSPDRTAVVDRAHAVSSRRAGRSSRSRSTCWPGSVPLLVQEHSDLVNSAVWCTWLMSAPNAIVTLLRVRTLFFF